MRRDAGKRRIALFVEGRAEKDTLSSFFHRWMDPQLPAGSRVGLSVQNFKGVSKYLNDLENQLQLHFTQSRANYVVGVVDLFGLPPQIDLSECSNVKERVMSARKQIKDLVPVEFRSRFRQHFAVHEFEAWLLAYPDKWPKSISDQFPKKPPEQVNFDEPPSKLLKRLHKRRYKKTVRSRNILQSADAQTAIDQCPYLKRLADDLLEIAKVLA